MTSIFDEIENRMPEDDFYTTIFNNVIKSFVLITILVVIGWVIYYILLPVISEGCITNYLISCIITTVAFVYMFKPNTSISAVAWVGFSLLYSSIMYLIGESIIVSMILLGGLLTFAMIISEISFTGFFTYKDLKEWVRSDKLLRVSSEHVEKTVDEDTQQEF